MSRSLISIIDKALVPAALTVVGKALGLFITVTVFQIPWTVVQLQDTFLSTRPSVFGGDLVTVSTYSDLVMYLILAVGFSFILFQATYLHESHISPQMLVRLSTHNLMGLVKSSFDIYHTATIWLVFLWVGWFTVIINVALQKTSLWLGLAVLLANVVFTAILLQDVYKEIEISKHSLGNQPVFS